MLDSVVHRPRVVPFTDTEAWQALRASTIGSSEVAALFLASDRDDSDPEAEDDESDWHAASPYLTAYGLWALKTRAITRDEAPSNQRIRWGSILEPIVAQEIAARCGWSIRKPAGYYVHPTYPMIGASLDYEVDPHGEGRFIPLEIKCVDSHERRKWTNAAGKMIVPAHIQLQVQHQLAVTGCRRAIVATLFGGNHDEIFELERDEEVIAAIERDVPAFWEQHVVPRIPPRIDHDRDAKLLRRLSARIDPGSVIDWRMNNHARMLVATMLDRSAIANAAKKEASRARSELMELMGDAEIADLGDILLKRTRTEPHTIVYTSPAITKLTTLNPSKKHAGKSLRDAAKD